MVSCKSLFAAGVALLAPLASALQITGPGIDKYWVFGTSNEITWVYDRKLDAAITNITITVTNPTMDFLNGEFSIAEGVYIVSESYTVTKVTLRPATGYRVNFVKGDDHTKVYASSASFEVLAEKPASSAGAASGSQTGTATPTSTGVVAATAQIIRGGSGSGSNSDENGALATIPKGVVVFSAAAIGVVAGVFTFI